MFKRVEKRRRKKKEEEELGLDEEVKEVLGLNDTDSEESASDSDSQEGDNAEDRIEEQDLEDENGSLEESQDEEDPNISVTQALNDPIYIISVLPDEKACIVCPGKHLKSLNMVQLHRNSNAHVRRFKLLKSLATDSNQNESALSILRLHEEDKPKASSTPGISKRAERRKAYNAKQKLLRRQRKKETSRVTLKGEKDEAHPDPDPNTSPKQNKTVGDEETHENSSPKKKRKIEGAGDLPEKQKKKTKTKTNSLSVKDVKESIKKIARSTSDRAKNARSKALAPK